MTNSEQPDPENTAGILFIPEGMSYMGQQHENAVRGVLTGQVDMGIFMRPMVNDPDDEQLHERGSE